MSLSEGYIAFAWNYPDYSNDFALCETLIDIVAEAFHNNRDADNKLYIMLPGFNSSQFSDLVVGTDIGYKSINVATHGSVHCKDIQMSYVENGERYYVSLLNSLNIHAGSMYYQSNQMLVIKEKDGSANSVYYTIANAASAGLV